MNDIVHTAIYDGLPDWEVAIAIAHINSPLWQRELNRWQVMTVGETGEPVTTMGGVRILPDVVIDEVQPTDSAMLILPGADSWLEGGNVIFADKAQAFLEAGVPVAAICGATAGLAAAGLLDDRDHTSNAPHSSTPPATPAATAIATSPPSATATSSPPAPPRQSSSPARSSDASDSTNRACSNPGTSCTASKIRTDTKNCWQRLRDDRIRDGVAPLQTRKPTEPRRRWHEIGAGTGPVGERSALRDDGTLRGAR